MIDVAEHRCDTNFVRAAADLIDQRNLHVWTGRINGGDHRIEVDGLDGFVAWCAALGIEYAQTIAAAGWGLDGQLLARATGTLNGTQVDVHALLGRGESQVLLENGLPCQLARVCALLDWPHPASPEWLERGARRV
jgi:hypothetical protein